MIHILRVWCTKYCDNDDFIFILSLQVNEERSRVTFCSVWISVKSAYKEPAYFGYKELIFISQSLVRTYVYKELRL